MVANSPSRHRAVARCLAALAALVVMSALGLSGGSALARSQEDQDAATVRDWMIPFTKCIPHHPIGVVLYGLEDTDALDEPNSVRLRKYVDNLMKQPLLESLFTVQDPEKAMKVARQQSLMSGSRDQMSQVLMRETQANLVVFIRVERPDPETVSFTLSGSSDSGECTSSDSDEMTYKMVRPNTISNFNKSLNSFFGSLVDMDGDVQAIDVCPIKPEGNLSDVCVEPIKGRLEQAITGARSASMRLSSRETLRVNYKTEKECVGTQAAPALRLSFAPTKSPNMLHLSMRLLEGGSVTKVNDADVVDLPTGCDPTQLAKPLTLQDEALKDAREDAGMLDVSAAADTLVVGSIPKISIKTGAALQLYCWIIGPDETASVLIPNGVPGSVPSTDGATEVSYSSPRFKAIPVQFDKAEKDLFACFGSPKPLPPDVRGAWLAGWTKAPDGTMMPRLLSRDAALGLLRKTRAVDSVVEAHAWLDVADIPGK